MKTILLFKLSNFEHTLLQGIAKGLSSTDLAEILCKSPRTIEKNRLDLYAKFKVANKEQLIVEAMKYSLL